MVKRRLQTKAAAAARLPVASSSQLIQGSNASKAAARGKRGKRAVARENTRAWIAEELEKKLNANSKSSNSNDGKGKKKKGQQTTKLLSTLGTDLSAALAEATSIADEAAEKKANRPVGWRATADVERKRLSAVLSAPRFIDGGLDALRDHLEVAVSADAARAPPPISKKKKTEQQLNDASIYNYGANGRPRGATNQNNRPARSGTAATGGGTGAGKASSRSSTLSKEQRKLERERAARRRERKAEFAAQATAKRAAASSDGNQGGEQIKPQSLNDLLGGRKRGRIGEKRDKIL